MHVSLFTPISLSECEALCVCMRAVGSLGSIDRAWKTSLVQRDVGFNQERHTFRASVKMTPKDKHYSGSMANTAIKDQKQPSICEAFKLTRQ